MQPMPSAGKNATDAMRTRTVTGAQREEECNWGKARENISPMPIARKHVTCDIWFWFDCSSRSKRFLNQRFASERELKQTQITRNSIRKNPL